MDLRLNQNGAECLVEITWPLKINLYQKIKPGKTEMP
jgi:hypothetical protein